MPLAEGVTRREDRFTPKLSGSDLQAITERGKREVELEDKGARTTAVIFGTEDTWVSFPATNNCNEEWRGL